MDPAAGALFLMDCLALVLDLARIRDARLAVPEDGAEPVDIAAEVTGWRERRDQLWEEAESAVEAGAFLMLGAQASKLHRGVTDELALSLLFHTPGEHYAGRQLLAPQAPLTRHGLIKLEPIGPELNPDAYELRITQTFANFVLGQPIVFGPIAQYCELGPPLHSWESVMLPAADKERVWTAVAGMPEVQSRLDEWGYGAVMPRGRGIVLLFAGPPGVGKSMFAHAVASRLKRQMLSIHTSRLLETNESIRPVLEEAFRIAALPGEWLLWTTARPYWTRETRAFWPCWKPWIATRAS